MYVPLRNGVMMPNQSRVIFFLVISFFHFYLVFPLIYYVSFWRCMFIVFSV